MEWIGEGAAWTAGSDEIEIVLLEENMYSHETQPGWIFYCAIHLRKNK